jgi:hypothetical protein
VTDVPGGGGGYGEPDLGAARGAMQRVHELFGRNPGASVEEIRDVEGYGEIPEPVRRAIEGLSLSERLFVHRIFDELIDSGFSIELTGVEGY